MGKGENKMTRYIDINNINLRGIAVFDQDFEALIPLSDVRMALQTTPTADVQEVRHGKWIYCGHHEFHGHVFECSVCGRYLFANSKEDVYVEYPYCHCGAKMESVEGLEED